MLRTTSATVTALAAEPAAVVEVVRAVVAVAVAAGICSEEVRRGHVVLCARSRGTARARLPPAPAKCRGYGARCTDCQAGRGGRALAGSRLVTEQREPHRAQRLSRGDGLRDEVDVVAETDGERSSLGPARLSLAELGPTRGEPAVDVRLPEAPVAIRLAEPELPVPPLVAVGMLVLLDAKEAASQVVGHRGGVGRRRATCG